MPSEAPVHVEWPLPQDRLSPSALKQFDQCPEKFRRKYILGERDPASWSSVLGTAIHGAQEINLRQKTVTLRNMPLPDIEDVYSDAFEREIDEQGGRSEIDWKQKDGSMILPSKAKDKGRPVNKLYHELVAPTIQPLATEQWVRVRVPGVVPWIVGKVDVMELRGGKIDMKFGGRAQKEPRKDWLLQARIYNLADDTPFAWHTASWGNERYGPEIWTPRTAPGLRVVSTPEEKLITERIVRTYAAAIVAMYRQFGPDDPWPANGLWHTFACDYCPFYPGNGGACAYWPRVVQSKEKPRRTEATLV